ncbi:MAG: hypothetical protein ACYTG5_10985 [Planctomycetota bacterium]|jgi:hypothetical protein
MSKLPINLILYLITLGLLGGSGMYFYEAVNLPRSPDPKEIRDKAASALDKGRERDPQTVGPNYADDLPWVHFAEANFVGKLPPPPDMPKVDEGPKQPVVNTITPMDQIFSILGIYYDGDNSRVVIKYKPTANVQPPPDVLAARRGAAPRNTGPADRVPPARGARGARGRGTRGGQPTASMPTANPNEGLVHHLALGDPEQSKLWEPYHPIRLVSVANDAEFAVFEDQRNSEAKAGENQEWPEVRMFKETLGLPQEIMDVLVGSDASGASKSGQQANRGQGNQGTVAGQRRPSNGWQPTPTTKRVGTNRYDIGTSDLERINKDPARIFSEDVQISSYRQGGVQIRKISSQFQSFGLKVGDIVTHLNDRPVNNKTEAITLGKKLYKRGVRTFKVRVLTACGYTEERTYNAPN